MVSKAETLTLKGLISELKPEQKEIFDKYDQEFDKYLGILDSDVSDDEKGAFMLAFTSFCFKMDNKVS